MIPEGLSEDKTFFIVASGPSLTKTDCNKLRKNRVIAVNSSIQLVPFAEILYAGDHKWWSAYQNLWLGFPGKKYSINTTVSSEFPEVIQLPVESKKPLSKDKVSTGGNSAYQAACIAYLQGARLICLLGVDCRYIDGKKHWHGDHIRTSEYPLGNPTPLLFKQWVKNFDNLHIALQNEGVDLVNCSKESALNIPYRSLEQCLKEQRKQLKNLQSSRVLQNSG
jgi:hypothetical protein